MQKRQLSVSKFYQVVLPAVAASAMLSLTAVSASAASLTYDADTTAPANDGAGVWDTTTPNWYNGTSDGPWSNSAADTAAFGSGGAGGTVAVGTVNVGTISFPSVTSPYTLSGGMITLGSGITSTSAATINSVIAGTNGLTFSGTGSQIVQLGGANTYSGITTVASGGRLQANTSTALGASAGASATTLGTDYTNVTTGTVIVGPSTNVPFSTNEAFLINGTPGVGALRLLGGPVTLNSLVQLGSTSLIYNFGGYAATFNGNIDLQTFNLQTNHLGGAPATIGGIIQTSTNATTINGNIIGTGSGQSLIQSSGAPTLFNGVNTYTGTTNVTGVLGGTGSLVSATTIASTATVTAADYNTVGTLTFGTSLTINGRDVEDLTPSAADLLVVGSTLTLGSNSILKLQGTTGAPSYTLATFGSESGTFLPTSISFNGVAGLPAGYSLNYNPTSITLTAVPEPTTLAALSVGAFALLSRRRRRI